MRQTARLVFADKQKSGTTQCRPVACQRSRRSDVFWTRICGGFIHGIPLHFPTGRGERLLTPFPRGRSTRTAKCTDTREGARMKVVHLTSPETVAVRDVPARREAGAKELLLEPLIVGLTGSDATLFRRGAPAVDGFRQPHIPGSEFVARVVGIGRGVDARLLGARVVANPVSPCLQCEWCSEGSQNLCPNVRILGLPPVHGAMQQRFSWPASLCVPVPEEIPDELAILLLPLSVAIHAADRSQLQVMGTAAVVGCGHLGLTLIRTLLSMGVRDILAVDLIEYRRRAALEQGARYALTAHDAEELVRCWRRGGVDAAFDTSNASEGCRTAVTLTQIGGRVLIVGAPADNRIIFNAYDARRKELAIQFVRRPHDTLWRAVKLMQTGSLAGIERLITHQFE
ncbi:alcohol dehydrogenase catalytic domain-containing protein, partial [bacterium]|nr:alcohol dehydrogenase catalytic domain-containing protein [bacterium]